MKRKTAILIAIIISVAMTTSLFTISISYEERVTEREIVKIVDIISGFREGYCNNPNLGESTSNEIIEISDKYIVGFIGIRLSWDDDHCNIDSQDTYDTFMLVLSSQNESVEGKNNEGEIILGLGIENININADSVDEIVKEDFHPLGNRFDILIEISECGSYPLIRANGFLREDDPGNDWMLEYEILVVEYIQS